MQVIDRGVKDLADFAAYNGSALYSVGLRLLMINCSALSFSIGWAGSM